jgi:sugar lactone lactonase YvrE
MRVVDFKDVPGARSLGQGYWFPECPRYFDGEIFIVDGPAVRAVDWQGNQRTVADIPAKMLCLGLQVEQNGDIYVGAPMDRKVYKISGDVVTEVADISSVTEAPNNELVRLAGGEFILGNMGFNPMTDPEPKPGGLYRVSTTGEISQIGPAFPFANGMVLTPDAATLFVVGDRGQTIYEVALTPDGHATSWEAHQLSGDPRASADGIGLTRDGRLWYGDMLCGAVIRPDSEGARDIVLNTGKPHATACTVFDRDGEEWLAMTVCSYHATPEHAHERSGEILIAPLAAIEAAAQ